MFAGFQNDAELIQKQEANQLQVIKKAEIFNDGKYKRMAEVMVKEGEEYFVDLKEDDNPPKEPSDEEEKQEEPKAQSIQDKLKERRLRILREENMSDYDDSEDEQEESVT